MFNILESCDILEELLDYLSWTGFMDNDELEQYDEALTTIRKYIKTNAALAAIRNYIKINEGECHD